MRYRSCNLGACEEGRGVDHIRQEYCELHPLSNSYEVWKTFSLGEWWEEGRGEEVGYGGTIWRRGGGGGGGGGGGLRGVMIQP